MARQRIGALAVAALLFAGGGLTACSSASEEPEGSVEIVWSQSKPEVVDYFNTVIDEFEAANPGITVKQVYDGDQATTLAADAARNTLPDVISGNQSQALAEIVRGGLAADLSDLDAAKAVSPSALTMLQETVANVDGQVNSLPFALSASGVLYNIDLFEQAGVSVPTTWGELIAAAEKLQAAGITPLQGTYVDAWTASIPFNGIGATLLPDEFWTSVNDGSISDEQAFVEWMDPVAQKLLELYSFASPAATSTDYSAGNAAFANGEAAMYVQGPWIKPVLTEANPDLNYGVFPLPASDDLAEVQIPALSDITFLAAANGKNVDAARTFINYMVNEERIDAYIASQGGAFSPISGADTTTEDPSIAGLAELMGQEKYVVQPGVRFPAAVPYQPALQQLLLSGDAGAFSSTLWADWSRSLGRS